LGYFNDDNDDDEKEEEQKKKKKKKKKNNAYGAVIIVKPMQWRNATIRPPSLSRVGAPLAFCLFVGAPSHRPPSLDAADTPSLCH